MENQETKKDRDIGCYMNRVLKIKLAGLLRAERLKRGLTYQDIAKSVGLKMKRVYSVEHGRERMNWAVAGMLLRYFHKRIVLELEDMDVSGRDLVFARMKDKPTEYPLDVIDD